MKRYTIFSWLFSLVIFYPNIILSICFDDSKIDLVEETVDEIQATSETILNEVCTADSKIDEATDITYITVSKLETLDSKIDTASITVVTTDSKIDLLDNTIIEVDSQLDSINTNIDNSLIKACTTLSFIDIMDDSIASIDSLVDDIAVEIETIDSKIDIIDSFAQSALNKSCTVQSKVDAVEVEVVSSKNKLITLDSKLDVVEANLESINSLIDTSQVGMNTVDSFIDVTDSVLDAIMEKSCTIDSRADVIDSKVEIVQTDADDLLSKLDELGVDFQETWTALQPIQDKACDISTQLDTVDSKIDAIPVNIDLSGTYTALAAIEDKVCTSESFIDVAYMKLENTSCSTQADFDGTYTMLAAMTEKAEIIGSIADTMDSDIEDIVDSYGIPIRQEDVGTTGYTITSPNRYFIAENIVFNPASSGLSAITINSDNVEVSFLRRTISQTGAVSNTHGIVIVGGSEGVEISEASIRDFTGEGIEVEASSISIFIRSCNIKNVQGNGMSFLANSDTIFINDTIVSECGADGINTFSVVNFFMDNCMITDNGLSTTNNGITIADSENVILQGVMAAENMGNGFDIASTTTGVNTVLEKCKAFDNGNHGIFMSHMNDSTIKYCVSNTNNADGIRLNDCINVGVVGNYCSNNSDDSIVLGAESTGSSDCYIGENSMLLTGSVNLREEPLSGPNSVLTNFALADNSDDNYVTESGFTFLNFVVVDQAGSFPATPPNRWYNISMTT